MSSRKKRLKREAVVNPKKNERIGPSPDLMYFIMKDFLDGKIPEQDFIRHLNRFLACYDVAVQGLGENPVSAMGPPVEARLPAEERLKR